MSHLYVCVCVLAGAIIYTLFAIFAAICYPFMRRRIPFSKAVLQCVMLVISTVSQNVYEVD